MRQRGPRDGLRHRRQVVGQPHHPQRVDKAGAAARYPIRAPAMPNALDMVRLTARFGCSASSSNADGVPARRNSPYASSTTTTQPPGTSVGRREHML